MRGCLDGSGLFAGLKWKKSAEEGKINYLLVKGAPSLQSALRGFIKQCTGSIGLLAFTRLSFSAVGCTRYVICHSSDSHLWLSAAETVISGLFR